MTEPEYAPIPRVTHCSSGVFVSGLGLFDEESADQLVRHIAGALRKHRKRRDAFAPAVSVNGDSIVIDRIGALSVTGALTLATRVADAVAQLKGEGEQ